MKAFEFRLVHSSKIYQLMWMRKMAGNDEFIRFTEHLRQKRECIRLHFVVKGLYRSASRRYMIY